MSISRHYVLCHYDVITFFLLSSYCMFINLYENLKYSLRHSLLFCFVMDRRNVFNELVEYYGKLFPHHKGKWQVVANEWKNMKNIDNDNKFMNAASWKKEWKDHQIKEGRENMNKFFMNVKKERSATPSVETSSVTATNT